ncbi:MAG: hypothetical protein GX601_06715 [Anaerolineales bacterium]|jgi:hypothetical protein|nr:hypothetical protein [Anaerolineales bacterium]
MTERATLNQITQVGVETTPGNEAAANKLLQALTISPGIAVDVSRFRPAGGKFTTLAALGKEWVDARIEGQGCYNHLAYLFSSVLSFASPVKQGSTDAYKWTFTPAHSAADTIKTFTVEQGSDARAGKFTYGLVTQVGLRIDRSGVAVTGAMIGQAYQDGISMTGSPTAVDAQPIQPTEVDIYLDDTGTGIGTTKLARALRAEFEIGDRYAPVWPLNSAIDGFAAHVETAPTASLRLLVEADQEGMGLLSAMRAGAKRFVRLLATGPIIADTYHYKLALDVCGVVAEVSEFSDEDGVYGIEWTLDVAYDATWQKALTVELVNTVSAL